MNSSDDPKRVLVVSLKQEAQPVLGQLRAAGHQVSLVEDLDEAQSFLASGGFDQAVLAASSLAVLLERRLVWDGIDSDGWRRSAAGIAHNLRNLLRSLQRSVQELHERHLTDDRSEGDFIEINRTVSVLSDFLLELTNELTSGTADDLSIGVADLEDLVETSAMAVYPIAAERQQRLAIDIDSAVARVRVDAVKVKRALTQLLTHASKEAPSIGFVRVRAYPEDNGCVISVSFPGDTLTLPELNSLFRPPLDTHDLDGASLSTVQRLIQQHRGRVWVERQTGSDTAIFASLPDAVVTPESSLASLASE